MPVNQVLKAEPGQYPELDNLEPGSKISFSGEGTLVEGGIQIDSIEMESSDNEATRELNRMVKGPKMATMMGGKSKIEKGDGF